MFYWTDDIGFNLWVSILVLVELPLKFVQDLLARMDKHCFNPCFSGTPSQIMGEDQVRLLSLIRFNPCFSGTPSQIAFGP